MCEREEGLLLMGRGKFGILSGMFKRSPVISYLQINLFILRLPSARLPKAISFRKLSQFTYMPE